VPSAGVGREVTGGSPRRQLSAPGTGQVPSNEKRDGNERRIVVQVPSREGIEVSREIGYVGSLR